MAEEVRKERADARRRRRSLTAQPFEELDEAAGEHTDGASTPLAAAKGVATTAAAAALAGALAGAAKALFERESRPAEDESSEDEAQEEPDEPQAATHVQAEDEPDEDEDETSREEESQAAAPQAEADTDDEPTAAHEEPQEADEADQPANSEPDEPEPSAEHEDDSDGTDGRPQSDAIQIVQQAREHLKDLLGADAESVSGIERENGNWSVKLEVVELHRIPESTDILSSYSAVLDDDGGIVSLTRGRRYRRSQVEDA